MKRETEGFVSEKNRIELQTLRVVVLWATFSGQIHDSIHLHCQLNLGIRTRPRVVDSF